VVNKVVALFSSFLQRLVFAFGSKKVQLELLQNLAIKEYKQQLKYSKKHTRDGASKN